jgi:methionine-rich copper-binding protein CopC
MVLSTGYIHRLAKWSSALLLLITFTATLYGHAVLVKSAPKANEKLKGPSIPVTLVFNSRVDQARSVLTLDRPGNPACPLVIKKDSSRPEALTSAVSDATPGRYLLHWQVLSVDGHITRGQIEFEVN